MGRQGHPKLASGLLVSTPMDTHAHTNTELSDDFVTTLLSNTVTIRQHGASDQRARSTDVDRT